MCSLDVEFLFTNIPVKETIDIYVDMLYNGDPVHTPKMKKEHFHEFLTLVVNDNCFIFNGILYTQIDGVAMGSPLGPVLASIFLAHLENEFLTKHKDFPLFYRRYVDDTFCVFNISQL